MYFCGIDIGSRTSKIVVIKEGKPVYHEEVLTGIHPGDTARELEERARQAVSPVGEMPILATGYGRNTVSSSYKVISEISCHARGVFYYFPQAELVIDIGGQDSKGIQMGEIGRVLDFVMNDRCAAGSGRFLEKLAELLHVRLDELGILTQQAQQSVEINSTCVVFAESEIIGQMAKGADMADIAAGVHLALARRIRNLVAHLSGEHIVFTGGVARNSAMKKALEDVFQQKIDVPENPGITGALGAALLAEQEYDR